MPIDIAKGPYVPFSSNLAEEVTEKKWKRCFLIFPDLNVMATHRTITGPPTSNVKMQKEKNGKWHMSLAPPNCLWMLDVHGCPAEWRGHERVNGPFP